MVVFFYLYFVGAETALFLSQDRFKNKIVSAKKSNFRHKKKKLFASVKKML